MSAFIDGCARMVAHMGTVYYGGSATPIYIDDLANTSNGNRTWYDGVGYQLIPTPATLTLLSLAGFGVAQRRR